MEVVRALHFRGVARVLPFQGGLDCLRLQRCGSLRPEFRTFVL
ncbi:hypothetical protein [Actinomadura sp. 21ATH]